MGILAGLIWGECCDYVAVYRDMGISSGMKAAMDHWDSLGKRVEWRTIQPELYRAVCDMEG